MKSFLTLFLFVLGTMSVFAQAEQAPAEQSQSVVLSEEGDSPVILFDKREITQGELAAIDQSQIGDIQILSGQEAKERYGKYGTLGAIVITSSAQVPEQIEKTVKLKPSAPAEQKTVTYSDEVKMSFGSDLDAHIIIDGKPSTMDVLQALKPEQIKTMVVVKGSEAQKTYGEVAKEGAIEVTTKQ